jgi:hypothetical protein
MIEGYLIEAVLTLLVMFNVAVVSFFWYKYRELESKFDNYKKQTDQIMYRFFGMNEDETNEGFLMESEGRFDRIDNKLEEICQKIDRESIKREEQYSDLETRLEVITHLLTEEEAIEFEKEDIEEYQNSFQ